MGESRDGRELGDETYDMDRSQLRSRLRAAERRAVKPVAKKRTYVPEPKRGVLEAKWGREDHHADPSIVYVHGGGGSQRPDARLLSTWFEGRDVSTGQHIFGCDKNNFLAELDRRGYDITTLKFSIKLKEPTE